MPKIEGKLEECTNGYHILRERDLIKWFAPTLWRVEVEGELIEFENKCVARKARITTRIESWNRATWIEFACRCAERVIDNYPGDKTPLRDAIRAARNVVAEGFSEASIEKAWSAANAAESAARSAAWSAANAAERKHQTQILIELLG